MRFSTIASASLLPTLLLAAGLHLAACGDDASSEQDGGDANTDTGTGPCAELRAGDVCRASTGPCDLEERCVGGSDACPMDAQAANGAPCTMMDGDTRTFGVCRAGACSPECEDGATCTTGVACEIGVLDCSGDAAACNADEGRSRTQCGDRCIDVQNDALNCGRCDSPCGPGEACVRGECSSEGVCAGQPAGTVCRAAISACDRQEVCDGTGTACPPDDVSPAGTVCRPAAGACDVEETCSGTTPSCPADAVRPAGRSCETPDGMMSTCTGEPTCGPPVCMEEPCDTGNPCEVGRIDCDMDPPTCVAMANEPDGTTCGAVMADDFGDCNFDAACDEAGMRSRMVTTPTCNAGVCGDVTSTEMEACTRVTEGDSCGDVVTGMFGACEYASECAEMGSRAREVMTPACAAGVCETTTTMETEDCTRVTEGMGCDMGAGTCSAGACMPL